MNSNFFRKTLFSALTIGAAALIISSCDKEDDNDNNNNKTYTVSASATGAQETPAITTSATSTLTGNYNAGTNTLTYNINWTGLSGVVTVAHFHGPAAVGVAADPLLPITINTNGATGSTSGSVVVADSVETALLDGKIYYNLHTAAHPTGEVRGQLATVKN